MYPAAGYWYRMRRQLISGIWDELCPVLFLPPASGSKWSMTRAWIRNIMYSSGSETLAGILTMFRQCLVKIVPI